MTDAEELQRLESDIDDLGKQIEAKRTRALEIMRNRIGVIRGKRVRIEKVSVQFGGMRTARLWYSGPVLKKDGQPHARETESRPLILFDKIEPRDARSI